MYHNVWFAFFIIYYAPCNVFFSGLFVPMWTSMVTPFPSPMIRCTLSVTCSILAHGKQTTMSSSLFSLESVFLTMESPTYIVEFLLISSITAAEWGFLLSPSCALSPPIFVPLLVFSCPSFLVVSLSSSWSVSSMMIMRYWHVSHLSVFILHQPPVFVFLVPRQVD